MRELPYLLVALVLFLVAPLARAGDDLPSFAELEERLRDPTPSRRRRAVRDLALRGEPAAWKLVIERLADRHPEIADQAQFSLAALDDPKLIRGLLGRDGLTSREELVRRRVAEALGRMEVGFEAGDLLARVNRKDPETSEMLLWSIERLADRDLLEVDPKKTSRLLGKLIGGRHSPQVRAQALCALAAISAEAAAGALAAAGADRCEEVRIASLLVAQRLGPSPALATARRRLGDPAPAVRLIAAETLGWVGTKPVLPLLIERLEVEERLRIEVRLIELLQDLSGMKYRRGDPRPWRLWYSKLPEDWEPVRGGATTSSGNTVAFAGLPILSDRVSFLIDFSGSLWYEREGRPPRKGLVDELLAEALPRLSAETEFNLVPYTGEPHPWRPELVKVSERSVREALRDFERCTVKGKGNVFDAVLLALEDRRVDRIVIFTDGAPTGGSRWHLELMVSLLVQATRFRGVAIDSIVVDAPPRLEKRWGELAVRTGGVSIGVEM